MRTSKTGWCLTADRLSGIDAEAMRSRCTAIDCATVCEWRAAGHPPAPPYQPKVAPVHSSAPRKNGKVGVCECCGGATAGGRFIPGHDARLHSRLLKEARASDTEAGVEIRLRNWHTKGEYPWTLEMESMLSGMVDREKWLMTRISRRLQPS